MRRVVRILSLLSDHRWVELLVAIDVARVNVLSWLAVGLLDCVSKARDERTRVELLVAGLGSTAFVVGRARPARRGIAARFGCC